MAAKKKIDGRTKEGRALKARRAAREAKQDKKKKVATRAGKKPLRKVRMGGPKRIVKKSKAKPRTKVRIVKNQPFADGDVVTTREGFVGVVDGTVGDMVNVVLVRGFPGFHVVSITHKRDVLRATRLETSIYEKMRETVISAYDAGLARAASDAKIAAMKALAAVDAAPAIEPGPAFNVVELVEDVVAAAEAEQAEHLAIIADVLKGDGRTPAEVVHEE